MSVCKVRDLPLDKMLMWSRAGIIVYRKIGPHIEYVMGVDRKSGDISNFGGTIELSDGSPITAAIREFLEESLGVFGSPSASRMENCVAIYDDREVIIFYQLQYDKDKIVSRFNNTVTSSSEMQSLRFYSGKQFIELIANNSEPMYDRVRSLIVTAYFNHDITL